MIEYIIPLIESYVSAGLWAWAFIPILCLAFLACVPCVIRYFVRG